MQLHRQRGTHTIHTHTHRHTHTPGPLATMYTHTLPHTHQGPWATMGKPDSQLQAESEHTIGKLFSIVKETYYIS